MIEELTDLVEEAVLKEFEAISARGGVLGAMETGYPRGKIQEESMHDEHLKHEGTYPIIGVNTFRNPNGDPVPAKLEPILGSLRRPTSPHSGEVSTRQETWDAQVAHN